VERAPELLKAAWGSAETPESLRGNNESCKEAEGGAAVVVECGGPESPRVVECGGPASWLL